MTKIILIGGAPATGKTTLAKKLSKEFGIKYISADDIRSEMQKKFTKEEEPDLYRFPSETPEEHYSKHTVEESIELEKKRDSAVFKGVQKFLSKNKKDVIIEGITIHPKFISKIKQKVIPIFLIDLDKKRIRDIVFKRGLWAPAKDYSSWVKEIEVEYILKTNEYYLKDCKRLKLPYYIIKDRKETTKEILKKVKLLIF